MIYEDDFFDVTVPEIQRSSLAGSVLYLKSLDLPDIDILKFDFLDPPSCEHSFFIHCSYRELNTCAFLYPLEDSQVLKPIQHGWINSLMHLLSNLYIILFYLI